MTRAATAIVRRGPQRVITGAATKPPITTAAEMAQSTPAVCSTDWPSP
jgi:hypothetical protein